MKRLMAAVGLVLASSAGALAASCGVPDVTGNNASFIFVPLSVTGDDQSDCDVAPVLPVAATDRFVVYKVDARGEYILFDSGDIATLTVDAMGKLTVIKAEGENLDELFVSQYYAAGYGAQVGFSGHYDLTSTGLGGADVFSIDALVGTTTLASQEDSLDEIGLQQAGLMTHLDGISGLLTGGTLPLEGADEFGIVGGVGSYTLGLNGRYNLADGFSVLGGVSIVDLATPGANVSGGLTAGVIRYVQPGGDVLRYFGEGGVEAGLLSVGFTRHYDNGTVADYEATGQGDAMIGAIYARAGVLWAPDADNEVVFSASLKQSALGIGSYVEDDPESSANLFAADLSGTVSHFTTLKAGADWTTQLATDVDLTTSAALGTTYGAGASADIFGVGAVTGAPQSVVFAEYGLRLGWDVTPASRLDGFVLGSAGVGIGTHAQVGAGYHLTY